MANTMTLETLRVGYFEHWFQPPYKFTDFVREQGVTLKKVDTTQPNYLEEFDVVFIEQRGFNDSIENDELYVQGWVKRGGVLVFMNQSYQRWAPYFLPHEVGYTQLIHRYMPTINGPVTDPTFSEGTQRQYMSYLMPWVEEAGRRLFSEPEVITPDELLFWSVTTDSFGTSHFAEDTVGYKTVRTTTQDCFLLPDNWEVLGSFMDPAVRDGALIARTTYGEGMYFVNQLLFPEVESPDNERCLAFWRKYIKNLLAYFVRFKNGESEAMPTTRGELPMKKNYKTAIHMHSLDWYGCDAAPGTINALMRYKNWDICTLALKDNAPYEGKLDTAKFSDDKVLFLDGQEYHPFNFNDRYSKIGLNTYHMLAMGIDGDAYTQKFTRSLFSDGDVAAYLAECVDYVHEHGGAICATHPYVDYWKDYAVDGVDKEPMVPLSGTDIEEQWLAGKRFAVMNSVDLFGPHRANDNPAINFLYLGGEKPCRDAVVRAVRAGHVITAAGFDEADVTLGEYLPGDELTADEAANSTLHIAGKVFDGVIREVRVFAADNVIYTAQPNTAEVALDVSLAGLPLDKYIRVEMEGMTNHWICNSTPFYLK